MEKFLYTSACTKNGYNLWMAYPSKKEFAMSSLGYLWLFKIADTFEGIVTERIYTDTVKTQLNYEDIQGIAFSFSYDLDYTGILQILGKYHIPFLAKDRTKEHPIIFAGGPVITTNPEPYKNFFDFLIIGDGEEVMTEVLNILKENLPKDEALEKLVKIDGIYIPKYNNSASKATVKLQNVIYTPILSTNSYFKDTFIIEISRGCSNCCKFCTASYTNLPYRYYNFEDIIKTIDFGLQHTDKIALLGAQLSAHPQFGEIIEYLDKQLDNGNLKELSLSSLRADTISDKLIQTLVKAGQKTSTIAIEAASERLRSFIHKNLTEEQIFNAVNICKTNGLKGLKIYSMIGLPTETQDDINEFIILANKLKTEYKSFNFTFSFSTFVPKPRTPFQNEKREDTSSLEKKQKYLSKELQKLGINTKFSSAKWDFIETILSRGDDTLSEYLIQVYKAGGKLGAYKTLQKEMNLDFSKYINGYSQQEKHPWKIIKGMY